MLWRSVTPVPNTVIEGKTVELADISPTDIEWFRQQLLGWADGNLRDFPWRRTRAPYDILVAEFLLQKTAADRVVPIYDRLLQQFPTLEDLATADLPVLEELLAPLGLRFRAERLQQTARTIAAEFDGSIPNCETELLKLPGIGPYTARAILACAFEARSPVLDVNVARIFNRFFGLPRLRLPQRDERYKTLTVLVAPETRCDRWNLALLDFGALVCKASSPQCDACPLQQQCRYVQSSAPPARSSRPLQDGA